MTKVEAFILLMEHYEPGNYDQRLNRMDFSGAPPPYGESIKESIALYTIFNSHMRKEFGLTSLNFVYCKNTFEKKWYRFRHGIAIWVYTSRYAKYSCLPSLSIPKNEMTDKIMKLITSPLLGKVKKYIKKGEYDKVMVMAELCFQSLEEANR